jgi:hypothetical protein
VANELPGGGLVSAWLEVAEAMVDRVPAAAWVADRVDDVERALLVALRERLDELQQPTPVTTTADVTPPNVAEHVRHLLVTAEEQTPAEARSAAMLRTALELLPDEARILARLAGGAEDAVIQAHVGGQHVVRNHSAVGRNARVHSQDLTPTYVTHLLDLGLVELVPYEGDDVMEFELLESETAVRSVLGPYDHRKLVKPKVTRQLVRLSADGQAFCAVALP